MVSRTNTNSGECIVQSVRNNRNFAMHYWLGALCILIKQTVLSVDQVQRCKPFLHDANDIILNR